MYLLVIGNRRNYSHCLFLVRKAVLFQSNQKWWMVGRWMERNATFDFYCVLFISDFQRTHHFHFLMFTLKRTQKRTQVAKFSKQPPFLYLYLPLLYLYLPYVYLHLCVLTYPGSCSVYQPLLSDSLTATLQFCTGRGTFEA